MPPKRQYSSTSSEEGGEEHALFGKRVEKVEIEKAKRELFEGQAARPSRAAARPARAPVAAQPPVAVEGQAARPSRAAARPARARVAAQDPVGSSTSSYGDDSDRDKTVNPDKLSDEDSSDRKSRRLEEKKKKKELLKKKNKQPEPKKRDPGFPSGK